MVRLAVLRRWLAGAVLLVGGALLATAEMQQPSVIGAGAAAGSGAAVGSAPRGSSAQAPTQAPDAGGDAAQPRASARVEAPVAGMERRDPQTVGIALQAPLIKESPARSAGSGARELLLHSFTFDGDPVLTGKLHCKQLAPGVMEVTSLAYSLGEWQFRVHDHASFYGLGERFDTLDHAHTVVRNASMDNGGVKGASTYKPMPFFMSTSGYGLWVDTTAEAVFDLNASQTEDVLVTVPAIKLRVVVFTMAEFPRQLEAFTKLAGRTMVPPIWAFAPWYGRDAYRDATEVKADVDRARTLGLPASVILIDSPWATGYNSYQWNAKQWGDAAAMVKQLHGNGYKLVVWHTPWINSKSDPPGEAGMAGKLDAKSSNYDEAAERGYFVKRPDGAPYVGRWWKGEGSMIDFTNPAAKQWWQEQVRGVIRTGVDGFKDDDAEGSFVGDVKFADGTPKELMRGRYGVLYNNAVEDTIQGELKGNGVLFARSVTEGANGIGFLWGGDNESSFSPGNGLPTVVTAGLNAGMSGMPLWAADLPGYISAPDGSPDPEVALRWTEFAAFSPVMESFSSTNLQPWDWDAHWRDGKPGGTRALDIFRRYAVLHMSLFPYRYAAAKEAAATGMPILRSLALLYQSDVQAREARGEYMFGPDLLVAPVTDANTRRPVYLPEGQWVDFWTGAPVTGGHMILAEAPLETIPVYARAGAVLGEIPEDVMTLVPSTESGNTTVKTLDDRRVFEVIAGAPAGTLRWTDFEGRSIERTGNTLRIGAAHEAASSDSKTAARITVKWRSARPDGLSVDGKAQPAIAAGAGSTMEFVLPPGKDVTVSWR